MRSSLLTRAFAGAAAEQGARIETGVAARGLLRAGDRVCGVATSAGERPAGLVVLCPGSFAAECAAWIGPGARIPVEPVRGQIVALETPAPRCIVWGPGAYLVPKLDGSLVVGATVERVGFDARTTAGGVESLLAAARALLPETARARFLVASAGLRPDTPDHLPLVGPWPGAPGLVDRHGPLPERRAARAAHRPARGRRRARQGLGRAGLRPGTLRGVIEQLGQQLERIDEARARPVEQRVAVGEEDALAAAPRRVPASRAAS